LREIRGDQRAYCKEISGCGIIGIMNETGDAFSGEQVVIGICNMLERGNGLGAGYAGYGIYPDFKDCWCFHVMYQEDRAKDLAEDFLTKRFSLRHHEAIPTKKIKTLQSTPLLWRYFLDVPEEVADRDGSEEDYVIEAVMAINTRVDGAFVFSSGKDMGIFKGVGDPDEIAEFYRIPEYNGYIWTAHNRFPTNTPGWWGGAHPFGILDWSVIHNGEISSYGINRRYLENFGYYCCLSTDTEVMAYLFDLLVRRHGLDFEVAAKVMASPLLESDRKGGGPGGEGVLEDTADSIRFGLGERPLCCSGGQQPLHGRAKRQDQAASPCGGQAGQLPLHIL